MVITSLCSDEEKGRSMKEWRNSTVDVWQGFADQVWTEKANIVPDGEIFFSCTPIQWSMRVRELTGISFKHQVLYDDICDICAEKESTETSETCLNTMCDHINVLNDVTDP